MAVAVDVVTGPSAPSYTMEIVRRLPPEAVPVVLPSKSYAASPIGVAYRLVEHPMRVRRSRRTGSVLHVDTQLLAYVLAARMAPPKVLTVHDLVPFQPQYDDPSYVSRKGVMNRILYQRLARGLQRADRIIAVSDFTREELLRMGLEASRIEVVPMGVDVVAFRPRPPEECRGVRAKYGIPDGPPMVLYVGTEHPRKNLPALFRAFAQLGPSAILVKVGTPRHPQHEELERLARSLGIAQRVLSVERVAAEDLPRLYGAADVLVLPSLTEGFGLPPLEAMACGTPVAVSNVGSLPDLVRDAGVLFDPRDEMGIADALRQILANPDIRDRLRAAGRARAEEFRWEATVRGVLRAYRHALDAAG